MNDWYNISIDKKTIKKEREKAKILKKSKWWKDLLNLGVCYYCKNKFKTHELTMDHIVPIARGGKSVKSNIVLSCKTCNQNKKLKTPVESVLDNLKNQKK